ncbi:MAG: NAD-dependent epimerase/dehydratase family protein [Gammaproteobacteria bacterium]|nr:NAD-dependent epimerase/dehydratase family protein [Gammaproteobacteria bacterium]
MPTLVTGATGVAGPALVSALLERGDSVRVFAREASDVSRLDDAVEIVRGDVMDSASVNDAVAGCSRVFHLAAHFDSWAPNPKIYFDVNVGGAVNVLEAALEHGVEMLVHASSASTIGEHKEETGSEATEHRGYFLTNYERSKWEAEQFVFEYVAKGVPAVIVNPSSVYGPGDVTGNGLTIMRMVGGQMTASTQSMAAYLYLDDFVKGLIAAGEKGKVGERYILSGANVTRFEFLRTAAELAGIAPVITITPAWVIRTLAAFNAIRQKITGKRPAISADAAAIALHGFRYDSSKATRELGIEFTNLEDGLDATIDWLYREGHVDLPEDVLEDAPDNEDVDE